MEIQTTGKVVAVKKQWWLKINTKCFRKGPLDGAIFPYIIKVEYVADGKIYTKRKWINPGLPVPKLQSELPVVYCAEKPNKAKVVL